MEEPIRVYHNQACSKWRGVLELLAEGDIDVELVDYLADPPSAVELRDLCRRSV